MVVFPSWLPFFLQNPTKDNAAHAKTQDAKTQDAKTQDAKTQDAKNARNAMRSDKRRIGEIQKSDLIRNKSMAFSDAPQQTPHAFLKITMTNSVIYFFMNSCITWIE